MTFTVPTVDISTYVHGGSASARAAVASAMDSACSTVGFVQVLGHGVPDDAIAGLTSAMDDFFGRSLEEKSAFRMPAEINRGYSPPKSESLSLSIGVQQANRMNDFFEAFNVGAAASDFPGLDLPVADYAENVWPSESFRSRVLPYYREAARVARVLTSVFEDALGLDRGFFDDLTDHSVEMLRMNNYALPPGTIDLDGELVGMSEHTDFGIVTVLFADQVAGLQVLGTDGSWHDVSPADGALLVNLGDLTARLTNDRWMSTLHRVMPPIVDGTIKRRRSAAFFHDGNIDALITPLPSCVPAGSTPRYEPITVRDNLVAKLSGSRSLQSNPAAVAEAARVQAAAR